MIVTNIKALQIALKALAPFRADEHIYGKGSNRYAIEGVQIVAHADSLKVVATDGRKLAVAEIAEIQHGTESFILSAHTCEWITKLSPLDSRLSLQKEGIFQTTIEKNDTTCYKTNGSDGKTRLYIDGTFPPYADVIPKMTDAIMLNNKSTLEVTSIALEMLGELGAFCKVVNKNRAKGERATMRIQTNGSSATLATCVGEFGTIYTVVLMPCKTDKLDDYKTALRMKLDEQRAEMLAKRDARDDSKDDSNDPTSAEHVAPGANFSPVRIEALLSK